MSEYACDKCATEVENGHGYYPFGDTGDRVCRKCAVEIYADGTNTTITDIERDGLTPQERKQLRDVLNYALNADPDSLLRAIGEALVKMNPPIDSDEG